MTKLDITLLSSNCLVLGALLVLMTLRGAECAHGSVSNRGGRDGGQQAGASVLLAGKDERAS